MYTPHAFKDSRSLQVHPTRQYFAVAAKGNLPDIFIYDYPNLQIQKTLPKGTSQSYSCLSFNKSGDKLASGIPSK
jgi:hypothetical protein